MQSLEAAIAEVDPTPPMTTREMAGAISAELGIEAAPLTELVERFKQEEHALAMSLKTILQLRDEERSYLSIALSTGAVDLVEHEDTASFNAYRRDACIVSTICPIALDEMPD